MVTITPKKDGHSVLSRLQALLGGIQSRKIGFLLMFMALCGFMGMVAMLTVPSFDQKNYSRGIPGSTMPARGVAGVSNGAQTAMASVPGAAGGSGTILDPMLSKILALRHKAERTAQKLRGVSSDGGEKLGTEDGSSEARINVHEHRSSLPHHNNPAMNALHGRETDDHDLADMQREPEEPLDNSHDASHTLSHEAGGSGSGSGGSMGDTGSLVDNMYHSKFQHHLAEDHPHSASGEKRSEASRGGSDGSGIVVTANLEAVRIVPDDTNLAKTAFPIIRAVYASTAASIAPIKHGSNQEVDSGGDGTLNHETERPQDGVELFHKALRSGAICVDRSLPYVMGSPSTSLMSSPSPVFHGGYAPTRLESTLFEAVLDLVSASAPAAFIELTAAKLPLQQALAPLVARVFPTLATVIVPIGRVALGVQPKASNTGAKGDGDDDEKETQLERFTIPTQKGEDDKGTYKASSSDSSGASDRGSGDVCVEQSHPSNLHLTQQIHTDSLSATRNLLDGVYSCVQSIDEINSLVGKQLPFEFEESLGKILCRCRVSIIPKDLPTDPYFSYWESTTSLVKAAVGSLGMCSLRVDTTASHTNSKGFGKKIKNSHLIVLRVQSALDWDDKVGIGSSSASSSASDSAKFIPVTLSVPSGYIPVDHLLLPAQAGVQGPSLHHLAASLLEFYDKDTALGRPQAENVKMSTLVIIGSQIGVDPSSSPDRGHEMSGGVNGEISLRRESLSRLRKASEDLIVKYSLRGSTQNRRRLLTSLNSSTTQSGNTPSLNAAEDIPRVQYTAHYETVLSSAWELPASLESELSSHIPDLGRWDQMTRAYSGKPSTSTASKGKKSKDTSGEWVRNDKASPSMGLSDLSPIDLDARTQQHLLQNREELVYRKWMSASRVHWDKHSDVVSGDIDSILPKKMSHLLARSQLVYVFGRKISMMSAKIAASMVGSTQGTGSDNAGILVSILTDSHAVEAHQKLLRLLDVNNNVVCHSLLSVEQMAALLLAPERADVSIVQLDTFTRLLVLATSSVDSCANMAAKVEELVAAMMQLADISFVEVPGKSRLLQLFGLLLPEECLSVWSSRYSDSGGILLGHAVTAILHGGKVQAIVRPLHWYDDGSDGEQTHLYRVTLKHEVTSDDTNGLALRHSRQGISVYTLSHLGMDRFTRRKVLELYTELPLWSMAKSTESAARLPGVAPWTVYVSIVRSTGDRDSAKTGAGALSMLRLRYHDSSAKSNKEETRGDEHGNRVLLGAALSDGTTLAADRRRARLLYHMLQKELSAHDYELAGGKFSFVEHGSGHGYFSSYLAAQYPNATILSLERDKVKIDHHAHMVEELGLVNNAVCHKTQADDSILLNIVECPELFRFQLVSHGLVDAFSVSNLEDWGRNVGTILSSALTTFLYVPPGEQVSLAMAALFPWVSMERRIEPSSLHYDEQPLTGSLLGPHRSSEGIFLPLEDLVLPSRTEKHLLERSDIKYHEDITSHSDSSLFANFESSWLLGHSKAHAGHVEIDMVPLYLDVDIDDGVRDSSDPRLIRVPFIRCDIQNMTRRVHHHYDYKKDGHARTYTMGVEVNKTLTEATKDLMSSRYESISGTNGDQYHTHNHHASPRQADRDDFRYMHSVQYPDHIQMHPMPSERTRYSRSVAESKEVLKTVRKLGKTEIVDGKLVTHYINVTFPETNRLHIDGDDNASTAATRDGSPDVGISLPAGAHPNQNAIVTVHLHRDKDSWPIPYTSIYGITLISALRLGIHEMQRERLFHDFLKLPLYEDMAPWNVVLMGRRLDYIDYDTREVVFDGDIPKAYRVMSVLMNYKRTVEDFKRCGSKASTVYGLPYVSDCVGSNAVYHEKAEVGAGHRFGWGHVDEEEPKAERLKCSELAKPVPCGDGECHTDYISCLRSLGEKAEEISADIATQDTNNNLLGRKGVESGRAQAKPPTWHEALAESMRSHNGAFDEFGLTAGE